MRTKDESMLRVKYAPQPQIQQRRAAPSTSPIKTAPQESLKEKLHPKAETQLVPAPVRQDKTHEVRSLVAALIGIAADDIRLDVDTADYGIDSLMGMELGREGEL